jgi:hypothetical protein
MSDREPLLILRACTLPFAEVVRLASPARDALGDAWTQGAELHALTVALENSLHREAGSPAPGDRERAHERHAVLQLRRDVHNRRNLEPAAIAVAEPALSIELRARLSTWNEARARACATEALVREGYARDRNRAWTALLARIRDPLVQEGLRLVGRSLLDKADVLVGRDPSSWSHRERYAALKTLAYLARFCTKTSPNGVFCATALASWGDHARCRGENRLCGVVYLLSVAESRKVAACLAVGADVEHAIVPRANPTLRVVADSWSFWKPASPREPDDDDILTRMKPHPIAQKFLDEAGRSLAIPELIASVAAQTGYASDSPELRGFFDRLVRHGLLVAEVEVPYRSARPLRDLAKTVRALDANPTWLTAVDELEDRVDRMAEESWSERRESLDRIERDLTALTHYRELRRDDLFRADSATALDVTLPREWLGRLESFLHAYSRLYGAMYPERLFRDAYAQRFLERFPSDADVKALDLYHGLFEPGDLSRPWGFPPPPGNGAIADDSRRAYTRIRDTFAEQARLAEAEGRDEISLDELDWNALLGATPEPRWSCGVLFQIDANGATGASVDQGRLVVSAIYPGYGLASARLSHLHARNRRDPIADDTRNGWNWMEHDGAALAEITYMHGGRTANAGLRPTIVPREIELPGDRCTPGVEAFPLRDLVVRYDSTRGRFILRSRSRDLELIPILSSGISPEGFISFLLAIGRQDVQALGYFPGFEVPGIRRWPRMRWGGVVAFRRRWDVPARELSVHRPRVQPDEAFVELQRWRRRDDVPRHVFVSTAREPKPFFVDLESPPFVELFTHLTKPAASSGEIVHVVEMLPGPSGLWVHDERGAYASEFLVHLRNERERPDCASKSLP